MHRYSPLPPILLVSLLCLWLGAYAYWQDALVIGLPLCVGIVSFTIYLMRRSKKEAVRIECICLLTLPNLFFSFLGSFILPYMMIGPEWLAGFGYAFVILFQGIYVSIFCVLLGARASSGKVFAFAYVFFLLNLLAILKVLGALLSWW